MTHPTHTESHIPDEAVPQAAKLAAVKAYIEIDGKCRPVAMTAALTAALPHLSAPCAVEVVKLNWDGLVGFVGSFSYVVAPPSFTKGWRVWGKLSDKSASVGGVLITTTAANEEEAKAAAQADFERRTLSCVVTKPVELLDEASLQAKILEIGNQIHNLGCEHQNNEALKDRLQDLRDQLWGMAKDAAKPVDVAAVRRQAFEEAAAAIKCGCENSFCELDDAAEKIRALSPAEPVEHDDEYDINTYRELAAAAIEDLKNYAKDGDGSRLMVSHNSYLEDLARIDRAAPTSKGSE